MRHRQPRNTQQDIIDWLEHNQCSTEREIQIGCFDYYRTKGGESNKKYAELLRRALYTGKIDRIRIKLKGEDKRMTYRYFTPNINKINRIFMVCPK